MTETSNKPMILACDKDVMTLRRLEKVFFAAGLKCQTKESAPAIVDFAEGTRLLVVSENFLQFALTVAPPDCAVMVLAEEDSTAVLGVAAKDERVNHVFGRRATNPLRLWEVLHVVRRLIKHYELEGIKPFLHWGARMHETVVASSEDLHHVVEWVPTFCEKLGTPPKVQETFAELAHELLMNAVYDAPVDAEGKHLYALDRKQDVVLSEEQAALFSMGTDGETLAVSVRDPFGGLARRHVFGGMHRALAANGQLDTEGGGAGLGMLYIYQHGYGSFFTIKPGISTEVTVLYDLGLNRREFTTLPRSVHVFHES